MINLKTYKIWFVVGSQHLYGEETLKTVLAHAKAMTDGMNAEGGLPLALELKPVMTTPDAITRLLADADNDDECAGIITWMHTFSPSKMWINGLKVLRKPLLQFHTQYNAELPWSEIDMDFMNLNQSAHGDREHGFIHSRLRRPRKVVVGHWQQKKALDQIGCWMRAALAWADSQSAKFARIGDNMREVAVTEGDKVSAQICFGYSVNGYGLGDVAAYVNAVEDKALDALVGEYEDSYQVAADLRRGGGRHDSVREAARIELGLLAFLEQGGFHGFTTTFENLHGLRQLPGLPAQRLMAKGYGFGAEGDWKAAALLRAVKVMGAGLSGGSSFMEDYTYHMVEGEQMVLGAHMLEICPTIAADKPSLEVHPLGIGGKEDPARLVFNSQAGAGVNVAIMDMGNRFRLLINPAKVITAPEDLPKLPVARALWKPEPDFNTALAAWIYAGGAHHTAFSLAIGSEEIEDFAEIAGVEALMINKQTSLRSFREQIRNNEVYYHLKSNGIQ